MSSCCPQSGTRIGCTRALWYKSYNKNKHVHTCQNFPIRYYLLAKILRHFSDKKRFLDNFIFSAYSSQEASSNRSRNPFWELLLTVWNLDSNGQLDASSNLAHNSFFKVFSPARFPLCIVFSGFSHMGVLSICDKSPAKSPEKKKKHNSYDQARIPC